MKSVRKQRSSGLLFILLLFACLILVGVLLIAMGTGVYENVLRSMNQNDSSRTASAYLLQKVRQGQDAGAVSYGTLDGHDAILLKQTISGKEYETYLYCCDGELRELLAEKGNDALTAKAGSAVTGLDSMEIAEASSGDALIVTLMQDGSTQKLRILTNS